MTIRMVELFAGIGATRQAMTDLKIPVEVVGIAEIDKTAIAGYMAIHGDTPNLGDITKIERLPATDLITYSYPCQSLSVAGKQEGMKEGSGTTSSLVWEVGRLVKDLVERGEPPSVLLMENVDAVLNKKNITEFTKWVNLLSELGYTSSWEVLNAKDYGTPQNRRRCFMVSTIGRGKFIFPPKCPDGRVLRDVLEDHVDESYYLSEDRIKTFIRHKERNDAKGNGFGFKIRDLDKPASAITTNADRYCSNWISSPNIEVAGNIDLPGRPDLVKRVYDDSGAAPTLDTYGETKIITAGRLASGSNFVSATAVYDAEGIAPALTTTHPGIGLHKILDEGVRYPCDTKKGYMVANSGDGLVMARPTKARGTVQKQTSPTLTCGSKCDVGTVDENLRIRYLTPRECLRLQAFPESSIDALTDVIKSKAQLYKVAGNSIAVCVLRAIFKAIYLDNSFSAENDRQLTLRQWGLE